MSFSSDRAAQRAALDRLDALERERSALFAAEARAAAHVAAVFGDDDPGVVLEVAGTARVGQVRATSMLARGERLVELFPVALGLLEAGVMRVGTADILLEVSRNASREVQRRLDARCSEQVCLLDAADARRLVARAIPELEAELDADEQRERHERALAGRFVSLRATQDGMARVTADLGVLEARRFGLDLEELVRAQTVLDDRTGVQRTQAQRRADVLAKLPSLVLAVAEAAAKGRLGDLLPDSLLATALAGCAVPAPREGSDAWAAGRSGTGCSVAHDAAAAGARAEDLLGMDELPLDLPAGSAPPCWRRDTDALVRELLSLPVRGPVTMHVHTAMTTLLDLDQRSGWLEGFGAVAALHARILLPSADLRRVAVDARTGVPLGIDIPPNTPWFDTCDWNFETELAGHRHHPPDAPPGAPPDGPPDDEPGGGSDGGSDGGPARERSRGEAARQRARVLSLLRPLYLDQRAEPQHDPSRPLRRLAQVRDMACDGPGCPRAAAESDLDHEHDYAKGGATAAWNLKHRSPRCHTCKHHGWVVLHDGTTGATTWTSPAGSTYERQSFWPAPTAVPVDAALAAARIEPPLTVSDDPPYDAELPLWHEPLPRGSRHGRVIDPADVRDPHTRPGPIARETDRVMARINGTGTPGWDDGPPPF